MGRVTNYEELAQRVADEIARPDLLGHAMGWIEQVHQDLVTRMNDLREVELEATGNFVSGQDYITLPTGLTDLRAIRIDTNPVRKLDLVSADMMTQIQASNSASSRPIAMTWGGEYKMRLTPTPSTTDQYTVFYLGSLGTASASATSQVLRENQNVLLYGAAYFGCIYIKDAEGMSYYDSLYRDQRNAYQRHLGRVKMGGGKLRRRPDNVVNDSHRAS